MIEIKQEYIDDAVESMKREHFETLFEGAPTWSGYEDGFTLDELTGRAVMSIITRCTPLRNGDLPSPRRSTFLRFLILERFTIRHMEDEDVLEYKSCPGVYLWLRNGFICFGISGYSCVPPVCAYPVQELCNLLNRLGDMMPEIKSRIGKALKDAAREKTLWDIRATTLKSIIGEKNIKGIYHRGYNHMVVLSDELKAAYPELDNFPVLKKTFNRQVAELKKIYTKVGM